ncbi:hypothetical protein PG996_002828 [Apiospora saccharicola]|uniref:Ig-like domain-containing protein n=1 Tax=Apiospora saccharicola TaxID=335842 RepID=A0ABR1WKM2_9PEZI
MPRLLLVSSVQIICIQLKLIAATLQENFQCSSGVTCEIEFQTASPWSVGFSASAAAWEWLTGGFSVERSVETGNSWSCQKEGDVMFSLWKKQGQTAYTVQNHYVSCAGRQDVGSPYVIWSPNSRNINGFYYCVVGHQYCRNNGDRWLETDGPAGGA